MTPDLTTKHIMIVDDEAAAREMVAEYLSLQGFRTTMCDGGRSLRRLLSDTTPDLILLDLNMPEEDGLSIVRYVKGTTDVPVILLTATTSAIDRVVGLELGADDYLTKSCELRELLARVRSVLRRSRWSAPTTVRRRLAAIASFDLVGFGRFLQEDEAGTLAAIDRIFADIIGPGLAEHHGTVFKTMGDGALLEFVSVVDSVEWAMGFQRRLDDTPVVGAGGRRMTFRLGIAIGDVVFTGADRFGEGVALAVRVQEVGHPGRVTLSDFTHQLVRARITEAYADRGLHELKNIAEPMRVWDWAP